jgi:GTPase SAR1 family protein
MTLSQQVREVTSRWIGDLAPLARAVGQAGVVDGLRAALDEALSDPTIRVVACGEWNTGKSSLINALAGAPDLLPVDALPTTVHVTAVEHAPQTRLEVRRADQREQLSRQELDEVLRQGEPDPTVEEIRIATPIGPVEEGVCLIDTPGLEDLSKTRAEVTLNYLPRADVILLVLQAVQGVRHSELEFLRRLLTARERACVVAVLNKADQLHGAKAVAVQEAACRRQLEPLVPGVRVVAVSARRALEALEAGQPVPPESGIPALRAAIGDVLRRERGRLLAARFASAARPVLSALEVRVAAEEAGLGLSTREAEQQVVAFRQGRAAAARHNDAVFGQVKARLAGALEAWLADLSERLRQLTLRLGDEVDALQGQDNLRQFIEEKGVERAAAREYLELSEEAADVFRCALREAGKDLLDSEPELPPLAAGLGSPPPVDSAFLRIPGLIFQALEVLVVVLQKLPPAGKFGRALVLLAGSLRALLQNFVEGKLRSGIKQQVAQLPGLIRDTLLESLHDAAVQALRAVRDALEQQVAAVETGLVAARERLTGERGAVETRRAELASLGARLGDLRQRLERLPDDVARSPDVQPH